MVNGSREETVRRLCVVIVLLLVVSGCGGSGGSAGGDSLKQTCEKANNIQRLATKAEQELGQPDDLKAIAELGGAATGAARGAKKGSAAARDLNGVVDAAGQLHEDVANNQSQVPADVASLKNWLIKLAQDCSKVLTG
jgi:hypothetical protein